MTNQKQDLELEDDDVVDGEDNVVDKKNQSKDDSASDDNSAGDDDVDDLDVEVAGEEKDKSAQQKTRSEERRFKRSRRNKNRNRDQALIRQQQDVINEMKRNQDVMSERLDQISGQTDRVTSQNIEDRLVETQRVVDAAKRLHAEAITSGDSERAAQAMEDFVEARDALKSLQYYKHQLNNKKETPRQETREGSGNKNVEGFRDKSIERKFKAWHAENEWYDPRGSASPDADSRLAYGMDTILEAEGFDPRTDEYWDELNKRLAKKLPHRFNNQDDDEDDEEYEEDNQRGRNRMSAREARSEVRKKPSTGGSPRNTPNGQRKTITISSERASAMREMGYQPGTADWKRMAKKYADFDKQNA